ncbi:MAG TPA: hypothetical protein VFJ93_08615 [Gaiellaceae bacterium]|nr:hypothetical protein [Gaiellaceae bacterium]
MRRLGLVLVALALTAPLPAAGRSGAKPIVVVLHTGSTGRISGTAQYFSYGVVLRNRSTTRDAFGVKVRVFVLGNAGLVGVYVTTIPFIPAKTTYYVGNEPAALSTVQRATGVSAVVSIAGTTKASGSLPPATAQRPSGGRIRGTIGNRYKRSIVTRGTRLYAAYYDGAGKVIGGDRLKGVTFSAKTIAPKKAARFSGRLGQAVSATRIARVAVSVVPELARA